MKIFITGGTGFIGRHLVRRLSAAGHRITVLTRAERGESPFSREVSLISGDPGRPGSWQKTAAENEVIINLAGLSIFRRWIGKAKRMIRDSRILTTRNLVDAIAGAQETRPVFFSTSAVGYYGFHGDEELREASPPGDGFLAMMAREWEEEALRARGMAARVVITRFGIVLGRDGGALKTMVPIFCTFIGGPLGDGRQWMSWIHVEDLVQGMLFLMDHPEIEGPVNFTAPHPVRNKDFSITLGRALHRPSFMPVPGFALRFLMGEFGSILLKGQRVMPGVLLDSGYQFRYPTIDLAFQDLLTAH
ncbi:MAG: TIGR01777 family oxidoreductase [Deltaproteobacteria bacterium]|nr:TIGR01777 family oxidoreductase [Deltaproteobacteria bacterium]